MDWELKWRWKSDEVCGSDYKYFETEDDARDFIEVLKNNPYREITSMFLTHTMRII